MSFSVLLVWPITKKSQRHDPIMRTQQGRASRPKRQAILIFTSILVNMVFNVVLCSRILLAIFWKKKHVVLSFFHVFFSHLSPTSWALPTHRMWAVPHRYQAWCRHNSVASRCQACCLKGPRKAPKIKKSWGSGCQTSGLFACFFVFFFWSWDSLPTSLGNFTQMECTMPLYFSLCVSKNSSPCAVFGLNLHHQPLEGAHRNRHQSWPQKGYQNPSFLRAKRFPTKILRSWSASFLIVKTM